MTRFSKKYADGHQKDQRWRKFSGMDIGHKSFTQRPSSHAIARLKKRMLNHK